MTIQTLKPGFWLALIATLMAATVVVLGAYTRLVDAGLGCPDWPTCYGHLWAPLTPTDIETANIAYPEIPVDLNKTWPEMVHRYFASTLGLLIIGMNIISFRNRANKNQPVKLPLFLLGFVILQGAFGAWTVTLKLWPQVVTAHLLGGFTTLTLLAILTLRLGNFRFPEFNRVPLFRKPRQLAAWTLFAVATQVFLGGWTTSNYSALACPDLPKCQDQWWPTVDFKSGFDLTHPVGPNYQGGQLDLPSRTAIHMAHRIGAIITTLFVLALVIVLIKVGLSGWSLLLAGLLVLQVCLGLSNVAFSLPLSVAVLHNLGGALLLICISTLNVLLNRRDYNYD